MKPMNPRKACFAPRPARSAQAGVMLLEALLGLLIFSLGVLALVAMQAVSTSNVSNAKYRIEAAFAAQELMNYMWLSDPTPDTLKLGFAYPGGNSVYLMNWVTKLQGGSGLPGAGTYPPIVKIDPGVSINGGLCQPPPAIPGYAGPLYPIQCSTPVTVTIRWKAPDAIAPSNYVATTYITTP
jgi:type IV pilus assembly protein PilV